MYISVYPHICIHIISNYLYIQIYACVDVCVYTYMYMYSYLLQRIRGRRACRQPEALWSSFEEQNLSNKLALTITSFDICAVCTYVVHTAAQLYLQESTELHIHMHFLKKIARDTNASLYTYEFILFDSLSQVPVPVSHRAN